ncbi:MAG: Na+/H+ antiporter NhaA [Thiobacillus sp.]|nr:Na+/H+ antiporter NhaA [Thiobacillus sp.]
MKKQEHEEQAGVYTAPWERAFDRVLTPFEEFVHRQTTSGMLLMATALVALILANSAMAHFYHDVAHAQIALSIGPWALSKTLHHWVNDGLMALFFFVVGLELKREMLVGELAEPRQSALPIAAAIGGMVVPALLFYVINPGGDAARGWGIPMATDIAFAIGALALMAGRVHKGLITFLVALAIVDDLGAVLVIALFYTESINMAALGVAGGLIFLLVAMNMGGIRRLLPYYLLGAVLWLALLKSGLHATLAGVITAFIVPARPKYDPARFSQHVRELVDRFEASYVPGQNIMTNDKLRAVVQTLENGVHQVETPLQRAEHIWHLPVAFLVIPVFALFNAGIPIDFGQMGQTLGHPVTLGVLAGLVLGKFIGITGASWLALKAGIAQLPAGTRFSQVAGVGLLGGIGFTMSIFIAELGFAHQPEFLLMAKTGILAASLLSGVAGLAWIYFTTRKAT